MHHRHYTIVAVARASRGDHECACCVSCRSAGRPLIQFLHRRWGRWVDTPGQTCSFALPEPDRWCAVGRPEYQRESRDPIAAAEAPQDVWSVVARARTSDAPRTVAAARNAVFRRYLPMARTLANSPGPERRPVDPVRAEQAAELGLAQAVLGWRRSDRSGFELFASIAIAAQLDRIPAEPGLGPVGRSAGEPGVGDHR